MRAERVLHAQPGRIHCRVLCHALHVEQVLGLHQLAHHALFVKQALGLHQAVRCAIPVVQDFGVRKEKHRTYALELVQLDITALLGVQV